MSGQRAAAGSEAGLADDLAAAAAATAGTEAGAPTAASDGPAEPSWRQPPGPGLEAATAAAAEDTEAAGRSHAADVLAERSDGDADAFPDDESEPALSVFATSGAPLPPLGLTRRLAASAGAGEELRQAAAAAQLEERVASHTQASVGAGAAMPGRGPIAPFYEPAVPISSIAAMVTNAAHLRLLKKQAQNLLAFEELEMLRVILEEHSTPPHDTIDRINYADFCKAGAACETKIGPKCSRFFQASSFMTFKSDIRGRVPIYPFYLYVVRWVSLLQTRIDMSMLDKDHDGYLSQQELEAYIQQVVPRVDMPEGMSPSFLDTYAAVAARKFMFLHDQQRRGKVLIRDILLSRALTEIMDLQQAHGKDVEDNWFSIASACSTWETFQLLDLDSNGTLSKSELHMFKNEDLTDIFIERVFDEHVGRSKGVGEMDFWDFTDLVLALHEKHTPAGMAYLFRCLDLHGRGFLTSPDIYTLFRPIHKRWMDEGNYELDIADVKDEIWDMVRPSDQSRITINDLAKCGQGDTVISMLIDYAGFWTHDNREKQLAQQELDDGPDQPNDPV
eukprot:SM000154S01412  [mRNA]  locus=s154:226587:230833:+ [translate_table: standard]